MARSRLTLEQQVGGIFALLAVALVGATLLATDHFGRKAVTQAVRNQIASTADHFADALDRGMAERFREVKLLARSEPLRDNVAKDYGAVRSIFSRRKATLPEIAWIGFATPDGTVRAASDGLLEGVSVAERPWFAEGLKRAWVGDLHEAKLLATKLAPHPRGEPFRFVDVTAPVLNQAGAVVGVVGAHLSWTWAEEVRNDLLGSNEGATRALILSSDGEVVLGPRVGARPFTAEQIAFMKERRRGTLVSNGDGGPTLDGFAIAAGFRDYPGLGWIVVAQQPVTVAFATVEQTSWWVMSIGFALAALGGLAAWALARRVTQPIRALTAAAGQIGRDPHATMPRLTGTREITELSASLRALVRHVDAAERQAHDVAEHSLVSAQRFEREMTQLRVAADTDPLTGLLNRRAFFGVAEDAMDYRKRYGRNFAVLVADIDFFKQVNDTYGHAAGDVVIQQVGETLDGMVRTTDKVSRFGGEEFVVLLREVGAEGAEALAERMREAVRRTVVAFAEKTITVTISIGGTSAADGDQNIYEVIERADHALYAAKAAGRNRVVVTQASLSMRQAA